MDEQGQGDELYPIAVLIDELKVCNLLARYCFEAIRSTDALDSMMMCCSASMRFGDSPPSPSRWVLSAQGTSSYLSSTVRHTSRFNGVPD